MSYIGLIKFPPYKQKILLIFSYFVEFLILTNFFINLLIAIKNNSNPYSIETNNTFGIILIILFLLTYFIFMIIFFI